MKILIKISGNLTEEGNLREMAHDLKKIYKKRRVIIVHGGGSELTRYLKRMGFETKFYNGLRVTPLEAIEVVEMVLCGSINKRIVNVLNDEGIKSIGISGIDGDLIHARNIKELGCVGEAKKINKEFLEKILDLNFIPVIAPVGKDIYGNILNINADNVAGKIAEEIKVNHLFFFSDVEGIIDKNGKLIERLDIEKISLLISSGVIKDGMIPKLKYAYSAFKKGVNYIHILTWKGKGTILKQMEGFNYGTVLKNGGEK